MPRINPHTKILGLSLLLSVLIHLVLFSLYANIGSLDFAMPVRALAVTIVDLTYTPPTNPVSAAPVNLSDKPTQADAPSHHKPENQAENKPVVVNDPPIVELKTATERKPETSAEQLAATAINTSAAEASSHATTTAVDVFKTEQALPVEPEQPRQSVAATPVTTVNARKLVCPRSQQADLPAATPPPSSDYLRNLDEKLVYRISLLGFPVGTAELEAHGQKREVRISLKIKSDPFFSWLYQVNNLIETTHINDVLIINQIRQQEGSLRSNRGFTISLRDKSVFRVDGATGRNIRESLPNTGVVDILSGVYNLRNRSLQIGTSEIMHIYDSSSYAEVPVEVIRREMISLPAFRKVSAMLVQPKLKAEGLFKRISDVQIWLSDDQYKVPVKIITRIALGTVTAELVSTESKRGEALALQ